MAKLNENYLKLGAGYLFPEIARRVSEYKDKNPDADIMKLGIGNTTEPLTPAIVKGLHHGVDLLASIETYSGYCDDSSGEPKMKAAVQRYYDDLNVKVDLSEIFVSDGAKPDSGNIQSIFSKDNVVAVQDPAYPVYVDTNVIGGRSGQFQKKTGQYEGVAYMPCTEENDFFPELPSHKVDLIYLCSPNNPTGAVATKDQLKTFVDYALQNNAVIVFDAAYAAFIKDPDLPRSIFEIEGAEQCAIEIYSFSKLAGFTGVRLGWTIVPKTIVLEDGKEAELNRLWARRQNTFFNGASNIIQMGGIAALSAEGQKECQGLIDFYMENARIIREGLEQIGITVYGGTSAPYIWMKTPNNMSSWEFFDILLGQAHVVGTPGSGFGPSGEGYFRLSAFGHRENINQAVQSIQKNLKL